MSKLLNQKKFEKFYNFIIFIPLLSFIFGFYIDENSAGMGNYAGDISWIKKNIQIFLENDLREAIFHPELFGNRTPLIYILNKLFNPLFSDFEKYRISTFLFSLLGENNCIIQLIIACVFFFSNEITNLIFICSTQ